MCLDETFCLLSTNTNNFLPCTTFPDKEGCYLHFDINIGIIIQSGKVTHQGLVVRGNGHYNAAKDSNTFTHFKNYIHKLTLFIPWKKISKVCLVLSPTAQGYCARCTNGVTVMQTRPTWLGRTVLSAYFELPPMVFLHVAHSTGVATFVPMRPAVAPILELLNIRCTWT